MEPRASRISATASSGEGQERGGERAIAGMRVGAILHPAVLLTLACNWRIDRFGCEGFRTPAPVRAAPPSWGRHPQTFTNPDSDQLDR